MSDPTLPGTPGCPWYDPYCLISTPGGEGEDIPQPPGGLPPPMPGTVPGLPPFPGTTPTELCPPGLVCLTPEEQTSQKNARYLWGGVAGVVGIVAGIAIGGLLLR